MDTNHLIRRPSEYVTANRVTRVCVLICLLGLLNLFDLCMTVAAIENGVMFEANPLAKLVINNHGVVGVSLFKTVCVGISLVLFAATRRHRIAEWGCALGVVLYTAIGLIWMLYPLNTMIALRLAN